MAATLARKSKTTTAPKRPSAIRRRPREGQRKSLNLSLCVEHHMRFRALAILHERLPSEMLMDWIEEKSNGLRFSLPGLSIGDSDDGENPDGETLTVGETVHPFSTSDDVPSPGAGEGNGLEAEIPALRPARKRGERLPA